MMPADDIELKGEICRVSEDGRNWIVRLEKEIQWMSLAVIASETIGRLQLMSKNPAGILEVWTEVVWEWTKWVDAFRFTFVKKIETALDN